MVVTATFHKVGGPSGGGYGIIVRDQGPGSRDGLNQGGRYYVLEVGDRGEVGVWRREEDQWMDIRPWTASTAVASANGENRLSVKAIGSHLSLGVNGAEVAGRTDTALRDGSVGVFTGGDQNQVVLKQLTIQSTDRLPRDGGAARPSRPRDLKPRATNERNLIKRRAQALTAAGICPLLGAIVLLPAALAGWSE